MPLPLVLLLGLLPAGLVVAGGRRIGQGAEQSSRNIPYFLLAVLMISLLVIGLLDPLSPGSVIAMLLIPVVIGSAALVLIYLRQLFSGRNRWISLLLVLATLLLGLRVFQAQPDSSLAIFVVGGWVAVTLLWQAWDWPRGGRWLGIGLCAVLLLDGLLAIFVPNAIFVSWPHWIQNLMTLGLALVIPSALVVLGGRLVYALAKGSLQHGTAVLAVSGLGLGLAAFVYRIIEVHLLDFASDGLGTVFIVAISNFAAIAVAMLLWWTLRRWRIGLVFAGVVIGGVYLLLALIGPMKPDVVTAQRAAMIDAAVQTFDAAEGHYPASIYDLVPRYLLYVSDPLLYDDQTWCYQGGAGYYRLGYITRLLVGGPANGIALQNSAGQPPTGPWACDDELARYGGA